MNMTDLVSEDRAIARMEAGSKKKILENMSEILARYLPAHNAEQIFERLLARERLGSTGLGSGVALPHCRLEHLDKPIAAIATLVQETDFDSPDNRKVDIVFCLLVPEEATEEHLNILAGLAEMFSNVEFCRQLRNAEDNKELIGTVRHWQQNAAA